MKLRGKPWKTVKRRGSPNDVSVENGSGKSKDDVEGEISTEV